MYFRGCCQQTAGSGQGLSHGLKLFTKTIITVIVSLMKIKQKRFKSEGISPTLQEASSLGLTRSERDDAASFNPINSKPPAWEGKRLIKLFFPAASSGVFFFQSCLRHKYTKTTSRPNIILTTCLRSSCSSSTLLTLVFVLQPLGQNTSPDKTGRNTSLGPCVSVYSGSAKRSFCPMYTSP